MSKLKPEIKKKWTDALRSGEYEQGTGALKTHGEKYCCLGVLCDVLDSDRWGTDGTWSNSWSALPSHEWLNLFASGDDYSDIQNDLMNMNDNGEFTFSDIADWIDKHL